MEHQTKTTISGWDIETHNGNYRNAVQKVNRWLTHNAGAGRIGSSKILNDYQDFQEWHWERELRLGASEEDIREYPTIDFVRTMGELVQLDRPT